MTQESFSQQILAIQDTLYHVAYGLFLNQQDAADAVQECILLAWQNIHKLREERYMKTYVIRILINECYRLMRSRRNVVPLGELPITEAPPDSSNEALYDAIAALDKKLRLPILLHYMEGYKEVEIAQMLRCPVGTIKSRLRKARMLMKKSLETDWGMNHAKA